MKRWCGGGRTLVGWWWAMLHDAPSNSKPERPVGWLVKAVPCKKAGKILPPTNLEKIVFLCRKGLEIQIKCARLCLWMSLRKMRLLSAVISKRIAHHYHYLDPVIQSEFSNRCRSLCCETVFLFKWEERHCLFLSERLAVMPDFLKSKPVDCQIIWNDAKWTWCYEISRK